MRRFRQILFRATLGLLFALIVLCVVGAFLGADRAKTMFNSFPIWFFWGLWAFLLAVGLFAWGKMWRCPGLLAVHIGLLLILAGGIWGSHAAHEWRGKNSRAAYPKTPQEILLLNPNRKNDTQPARGTCSILWDSSSDHMKTERLPFVVQSPHAWLEYYPPEQRLWRLTGITYDDKQKQWNGTPLNDQVHQPSLFPAVNGEITVLGYNDTLRQVELQITRNGETMTNFILAGPGDSPALLSLVDLFGSRENWENAGRPCIAIHPPKQAIRDYKAEIIIHTDDGKTIRDVIEVNQPLHAEGYHFYLAAFDGKPPLFIRIVSDDGLYWVYAGFGLLMLGVVLRLWIEPAIRHISKKEADDAG